MTDFRILAQPIVNGLRHSSTSVETMLHEGVATALVSTERGITNPLGFIGTIGHIDTPLLRPDIISRTSEHLVGGTGSSAFDDAVRALHRLGAEHGVDGIMLHESPSGASIKFADTGLYEGGGRVTARLGAETIRALDGASRTVVALATH